MARLWRLLFAVALVVALTATAQPAWGHGGAHEDAAVDRQLLDAGRRLMVGGYDAPQPGPLVVVPFVDGPLPCGADSGGFRLPLSTGSAVTFLANRTHLEAGFDLTAPGYTAFAVDTASASRTLFMMQEHALSRHLLRAHVPGDNGTGAAREGLLGIPYRLPGAGAHDLGHDPEGGGIGIAYDRPADDAWCASDEPGHTALQVPRARLDDVLQAGAVVHVVALYDPELVDWLPHPVASTRVLQANLYLARPGEDPGRLAATFGGDPAAAEWTPPVVGALGVLLIAWAGRRHP